MNKRQKTKQMKKTLKRRDFIFIDGRGDENASKEIFERAKANGRSDDVLVLDFSKGKGGSFNPKTGKFTPIKVK